MQFSDEQKKIDWGYFEIADGQNHKGALNDELLIDFAKKNRIKFLWCKFSGATLIAIDEIRIFSDLERHLVFGSPITDQLSMFYLDPSPEITVTKTHQFSIPIIIFL